MTITILGAGCGSGLITLRGLAEIRRADKLMYKDKYEKKAARAAE